MFSKIIVIAMVGILVTGCATTPSYRPVVDMQGVDANAYERDLGECKAYATQVSPGQSAAAGAVAGAAFGALLGVAVGGRNNVGLGARLGAAEGVGVGAASGVASQFDIVKNCLRGRGYRVLH